jgi:hypothetical protein
MKIIKFKEDFVMKKVIQIGKLKGTKEVDKKDDKKQLSLLNNKNRLDFKKS